MTDAIAEFFEELGRRHEPLLAQVTGSVRLDLHQGSHTNHWLVAMDRGAIRVTRDDADADAVIGSTPELFGRVARGETNAIAAMLRGAMTVDGDLRLVLRLERLFPTPPGTRGPRRARPEGRTP